MSFGNGRNQTVHSKVSYTTIRADCNVANHSVGRIAGTEKVCRKCAVRFGPVCAKVRLFNTTAKRFRAGLVVGKLLICIDESSQSTFRDLPTLNQ